MARDDSGSGRKPGAKRPRKSGKAKRGDSGAKRTRAKPTSAARAGRASKVAGREPRPEEGEALSKPSGERFVPDEGAPLPAYEHTHRYALAASLLGGRRVLDLACGFGTGAQRLRGAGIETVALDLDRACARRAAPGVCADATQLPFRDSVFGGIVCFEAIEHLDEPRRLLAEVARLLAPGGLALISTPDREIFRERAGRVNPYHVSEMTAAEFEALLRQHFGHVAILGQSVWSGSWISPLGDGRPAEEGALRTVRVAAERVDLVGGAPQAPWVDPAGDLLPTPMFLVAICARSQTALRTALRGVRAGHLLHDPGQSLLGHYLQSMESKVEGETLIRSHAEHAYNLERLGAEQRERIEELDTHSANLQRRRKKLESHVENLESLTRQGSERIEELEGHVENLESLARGRSERIEELEEHLAGAKRAYGETRKHCEGLERLAAERGERAQELEGVTAALESERSERKGLIESLQRHVEAQEREGAATQDRARSLLELAEARLGRINELERQAAELEHRVTTLEMNETHLEARAEGLTSYAENLAVERDERTARIEQLVEQIGTLQAERDEARLPPEPPEAIERSAADSGQKEESAAPAGDEGPSPDVGRASSPSEKRDSGSS